MAAAMRRRVRGVRRRCRSGAVVAVRARDDVRCELDERALARAPLPVVARVAVFARAAGAGLASAAIDSSSVVTTRSALAGRSSGFFASRCPIS